MRVLTPDQEKVLERLLQYAGSSGVLETAFRRVRSEKGDSASIEDLLRHIAAVREELAAEKEAQPAAP
jgi:hypothetical protein